MDKLSKGKIGKSYQIKEISNLPFKVKKRLLELGLTIGQSIKIIRKSLLGKAFLVEIRGFTLTIRKDIAENIKI